MKTLQQNREEMEVALAAKARELALAQEDQRQEVAALKTKLQADLRATRDQLAGEIEKNIAALRDSSVARESLAEFFQELALKLRKDDVLEEFSNAVRAGKGT